MQTELAHIDTARTAFRARYAAAAQRALERFDALVEACNELRRLYDLALERFPSIQLTARERLGYEEIVDGKVVRVPGLPEPDPVAAGLPDLDMTKHGLNHPGEMRLHWLKHAHTNDGQPLVADAASVMPYGTADDSSVIRSAPAGETRFVRVRGIPLTLDGGRTEHQPGEVLELAHHIADQLVDAGAAEKVD